MKHIENIARANAILKEMNRIDVCEAIDVVCLNCVEDTLRDNSCCETCPVRKLYDSIKEERA